MRDAEGFPPSRLCPVCLEFEDECVCDPCDFQDDDWVDGGDDWDPRDDDEPSARWTQTHPPETIDFGSEAEFEWMHCATCRRSTDHVLCEHRGAGVAVLRCTDCFTQVTAVSEPRPTPAWLAPDDDLPF